MSNIDKTGRSLKRKNFDQFDSALSCLCFVIYQLIGGILCLYIPSFIGQILVEAVFIFATLTVCLTRKVDFFDGTKLNKKVQWTNVLMAVGISIVTLLAFNGLTNSFALSLEKLGYTSYLPSVEVKSFGAYMLYVFELCIIPAFFEETLFRGTILSGLKETNKHMAVFVSALFFMLMHGGPDQTIHQFILGIVLGYVFVYTGSLILPIIIHFTNNFIAVTILYIQGSSAVAEATETLSWGQIGITLLIGLLMAAVGAYLVYLLIKAMKRNSDNNLSKETPQGEVVVKEPEAGDIQNQPTKKNNKLVISAIVMFVVSGAYLVFNWVLTLILGFLR